MSIFSKFRQFFLFFIICQIRCHELNTYANSYAHLSAINKKTGNRVDVCVNYQQFRMRTVKLAESFDEAKGFQLRWWRKVSNNTNICPLPKVSERNIDYSGGVVPLEYRIDDDRTECTKQFVNNPTDFRNATQFQETQLKIYNASVALFILDRGRQFVQGWKDYLFSDFYDPFINNSNSLPTFYIYRKDFEQKIINQILENNNEMINDVELRFYRRNSSVVDLSMLIIWLIAMICVGGGGVWAFYRHRLGKDVIVTEINNQQKRENEEEEEEKEKEKAESFFCKNGNLPFICTLMLTLFVVIMLGYYFRTILIYLFNYMLVIFGSAAVFGSVRAFLSNFPFSKHRWYLAEIKYLPKSKWFPKKLSYTGLICGTLSVSLCVLWYFYRLTPFAFILLNFINITICLHVLKRVRLPSLKFVSILMTCMFIYDAIMVFGTPYWTKNGCSVMLEVATGMDCNHRKTNISGYPLPPIENKSPPEKFPMLIQVMHFDPMLSCIDLEVERDYQTSILGLGDIIIPGYLVAHCFTMNGFTEKTRLLYGIICLIGYGIGLIVTFFALAMMRMAQPALIYLVPFTLIPVLIIALVRKEFRKIWNGVPAEIDVLVETNEISMKAISDESENMVPSDETPTNV